LLNETCQTFIVAPSATIRQQQALPFRFKGQLLSPSGLSGPVPVLSVFLMWILSGLQVSIRETKDIREIG